MTLLFTEGFDRYNDNFDMRYSGIWLMDGTATHSINATGSNFSTPCLQTTGNGTIFRTHNWRKMGLEVGAPTNPRGGPSNPINISFWLWIDSTDPPTSTQGDFMQFFQTGAGTGGNVESVSSNDRFAIELTAGSLLQVNRWDTSSSVSLIASSATTTAMNDSTWRHIRLRFAGDNSTGIVQIWVDGSLEVNLTSTDTLSDGSPTGDGLDCFQMRGGFGATSRIDDIIIWDEEGSDFAYSGALPDGDFYIQTLRPNGNGNRTNFSTGGAGSTNAGRVDTDEVVTQIGSETTYVESTTAGQDDLYTFTDLTGVERNAYYACVAVARMRNPGFSTDQTARLLCRSDTTEENGTARTLRGAHRVFKHAYFSDPDGGGDWTEAQINAAEFGVENI